DTEVVEFAALPQRVADVVAIDPGRSFLVRPGEGVSLQEAIDMFCDTPDKAEILNPGGGVSQIYSPDGRTLCEPLGPSEEGVLYADIDLDVITYAKAVADPAGHYSRPDVTRLLLDANPKQPLERVAPDLTVVEQSAAAPAPAPAADGDQAAKPH
ncbi:MAG: nitrilase-related carbon-nitrogen hydrolase, partial [Pseudomonadota bacterium]